MGRSFRSKKLPWVGEERDTALPKGGRDLPLTLSSTVLAVCCLGAGAVGAASLSGHQRWGELVSPLWGSAINNPANLKLSRADPLLKPVDGSVPIPSSSPKDEPLASRKGQDNAAFVDRSALTAEPAASVGALSSSSPSALDRAPAPERQTLPEPAPATAPKVQFAQSEQSPAPIEPLLARARALIEAGNISGARLTLENAAAGRDSRALRALAETYDPIVLSRQGVRGISSDAAKAEELYRAAGETTRPVNAVAVAASR